MSIDVIKNYSTSNGWNEFTNIIPETKQYAERNTLGKRQSLDFGIKCYEAGIRDAQRGKTSASR
jgi:hypothetical protein